MFDFYVQKECCCLALQQQGQLQSCLIQISASLMKNVWSVKNR